MAALQQQLLPAPLLGLAAAGLGRARRMKGRMVAAGVDEM